MAPKNTLAKEERRLYNALIRLTQQLAKSLQFEDLYTPTVGEALSLPPGNDACVFG